MFVETKTARDAENAEVAQRVERHGDDSIQILNLTAFGLAPPANTTGFAAFEISPPSIVILSFPGPTSFRNAAVNVSNRLADNKTALAFVNRNVSTFSFACAVSALIDASDTLSKTTAGRKSGIWTSNRMLFTDRPRTFRTYKPYAGGVPISKYSPAIFGTSRADSSAVPPPSKVTSTSCKLMSSRKSSPTPF